jgi:hypothetical protein
MQLIGALASIRTRLKITSLRCAVQFLKHLFSFRRTFSPGIAKISYHILCLWSSILLDLVVHTLLVRYPQKKQLHTYKSGEHAGHQTPLLWKLLCCGNISRALLIDSFPLWANCWNHMVQESVPYWRSSWSAKLNFHNTLFHGTVKSNGLHVHLVCLCVIAFFGVP